jgi:hypothetical protein
LPPVSASTVGGIAEIGMTTSMTTTFPYLEVARVHGVLYADVLSYADTLDRSIRAWSPDWPRAAPAWIKDTEAAWCRERARRDLTARGTCSLLIDHMLIDDHDDSARPGSAKINSRTASAYSVKLGRSPAAKPSR